ncbi:MAG: ABC transporter ATP-binding protein [Candidatus Promineifilaceae bacterium]|nr:ABC transporter ATP-binding protein [Candidatus Promineifilaceae bacterium]
MLKVNEIDVAYGDAQVLFDVSIDIQEGDLTVVIGANGAGKTTLLKTISGVLRPENGTIEFLDQRIDTLAPNKIVADGIVQVPEGRLLFPDMSIRENLEMGAYLIKDKGKIEESLKSVFELFPILRERESQLAGTLSGGEQQMLAIGRGLMAEPKLIMFDEPSLGLAPKLVQSVFDLVQHINKTLGATVLLIEQNVRHSCEISDRAFVLENGRVVLQGTGREMLESDHVREAYLGL